MRFGGCGDKFLNELGEYPYRYQLDGRELDKFDQFSCRPVDGSYMKYV